MRKKIICGAVLAMGLLLGNNGFAASYDADSAAQEAAGVRAVEQKTQANEYAVGKMDYVENKNVFKTATLRHDTLTDSYRLAKYDTINIMIIGFPDGIGVNDITVGTDGYVQLPYAGSVQLAGLTLDEAKAVLMDALGKYIKIPDMSVFIKSYGPRKVYVMGEVSNPGIQNMSIDNLNVYAAISSAGGFTSHARSTQVQVIRVIDNTMYYEQLNIKNFIKKHDLTQNVALQDGDIVYIPQTNGIIWKEDVLPYVSAWALFRNLTK
ncbi:polysaccharide export outer membrane protein [Selenomonas ruminantium]|uniref:Polysaccharide export outer membrane protein n=1 Tax=Selenomonas ruminantium TaxID=971 RepID=A0A1I3HN36_SELRU|nr:polysaccharide biosynthesis/export family protein [Selenomonas ruminantium]SFI37188.1 polysaccharide export outer membrane protein [Selenomonas ruminantium]